MFARERTLNLLLWLLLAASITRLWLMPLPSSFWVDEMATVFVVHHPDHPSFAVAPQVPDSSWCGWGRGARIRPASLARINRRGPRARIGLRGRIRAARPRRRLPSRTRRLDG